MKRSFWIVLVLAGCLGAAMQLWAQAPASANEPGTNQNKPANQGQKPAGAEPQGGANPFPEDTSNVPVLPSKSAPAPLDGTSAGGDYGTGAAGTALPSEDLDPARSPDDPSPEVGTGQGQDSSSSLAGLESLLPKADEDQPSKKRKLEVKEPTHQEAASNDIDVGKYYLDNKNWKAALSRFQSAMILDPENPEVYWGLAETERHLGDFADARAYYQKVTDYDPDSRHGKEARKALKDPEIANAKSTNATPEPTEAPK